MIEGELSKRLKRLEEKQKKDFEYSKNMNKEWNEVAKIYVKANRILMWSTWTATAIIFAGFAISTYIRLSY